MKIESYKGEGLKMKNVEKFEYSENHDALNFYKFGVLHYYNYSAPASKWVLKDEARRRKFVI